MINDITYEPAFIAERIDIDLRSPADIEILPSETGRMHLLCKSIDEKDISLSDSETFALVYRVNKKTILDPKRRNRKFYLYVPDKGFETVKISSSVGNVRICGLTAGSAEVTGKVGDISIFSVNAGELSVSLNTGNITIEDSAAAKCISGSTAVGDISARLIGNSYDISASSSIGSVFKDDGSTAAAGGTPVTLKTCCGNISVSFV